MQRAASHDTIVRLAAEKRLFDAPPHAALFYDLDYANGRLGQLRTAFPEGTLHALAVKACPLTALLRRAGDDGFGAEASSAAELEQAIRAGIPADRIVFDSPAKTEAELEHALRLGVHVNADNIQEIDRIAALKGRGVPVTSVGARVNPEIGAGAIEASSTAMAGSKFGISLRDHSAVLIDRFEKHRWLSGIHVHIGSQGCDINLLASGVARAYEFGLLIERLMGNGRLSLFDIGGGLPVSYRAGVPGADFIQYAAALRPRMPGLFAKPWRLVTEFGRAVWANAGFAASRVEYTKRSHGRRIATIHVGGDLMPRTVYVPAVWRHELSVFDGRGRPKEGEPMEQDVAGPLCFSGDLVARGRLLPPIEPGDLIVVHDTGAYTLSMWSHYNSRLSPAVYGYEKSTGDLALLRKSTSVADAIRFWD